MRHTTIPQWACALLLLGACRLSPLAEEQAELPPGAEDGDGDGYASIASGGDDCDDGDDSIHPGAAEVCGDGLDNNCDGAIDDQGEGNVVGYLDRDEDGYGDPAKSRQACPQALQRDGYVTEAGDCADTNPSVKPGQPDLCNGVDDDCDEAVDEDEVARIGDDVFTDWPSALKHASGLDQTPVVRLCPSDEPLQVETVLWFQPSEIVVEGGGQSRSDVVVEHVSGGTIAEIRSGEITFRALTLRGSANSRALIVRQGGSLHLENVHVTENAAGGVQLYGFLNSGDEGEGARARIDTGSSLTHNGRSDVLGGAIHAVGSYDLEIENATLSNNEAKDGGAIYAGPLSGSVVDGSNTRITRSTLSDNAASERGGALYTYWREVHLEDTTIAGNTAAFGAGAWVYDTFLTGTCDDKGPTVIVSENEAIGAGGGLHLLVRAGASCLSLVDNGADARGGGVYAHPSSRSGLSWSILHDNEAELGGGVYAGRSAVFTVCDSEVYRNVGTDQGGGLYIDVAGGTAVTLDEVAFEPIPGELNQPEDIWADRGYQFRGAEPQRLRCNALGCEFL